MTSPEQADAASLGPLGSDLENGEPSRLFVFAGGGTGGHLAPGIAVAAELRRRDPACRIRFIGSGRPIEQRMIGPTGYELTAHDAPPLAQLKRRPLHFLKSHWKAIRDARRGFQFDRPAAVIGLGGFASVPIVLAARREGIPVLLLEQNVIPGRANWLLSRRHPICVTFTETRHHLPRRAICHVTGNPLREEILALYDNEFPLPDRERAGLRGASIDSNSNDPDSSLHPPSGRVGREERAAGEGRPLHVTTSGATAGSPSSASASQASSATKPEPITAGQAGSATQPKTLLILGGSHGSRQINDSALNAIRNLREQLADWHIIHQTGPDGCEEARRVYSDCSLSATVEPFFDNLPQLYAQTTLAISRAGATTLTEFAAAGIPSILIPYPHAAADHQTCNARAFSDAGAAILINNPTRSPAPLDLIPALQPLLENPTRLTTMTTATRTLAHPEATRAVTDLVTSIIS